MIASTKRIGVLGIGLMGKSIAIEYLRNGYDVTVYNRTTEKAKNLESYKARFSKSPKEMADECDIVFFCLTDYNSILNTILSSDGLTKTTNKDLIICNTSTISFNEANDVAKIIEGVGLSYLSTPLMGGPKSIETKELITMVSGCKKTYEQIKNILVVISKEIFFISENPSDASVIKLALNLNIALLAVALGESITFLKKSGLDSNLFIDILNSTYFKTGMSQTKGKKIVKNDFAPSFYLKNMEKDLQLIMDTSKNFDISLPVSSLCSQLYKAAKSSGFADLDYTSIHGFLLKLNNLL